MPHFIFEEVKPEADETAQLLSLSDRIRKGELFLVIEFPPTPCFRRPGDPQKELVRFYSNSSGVDQSGFSLPAAVNDGLRRVRLSQLGIDPARDSRTSCEMFR